MADNTGEKLIASNPNAHSNYFIEEIIEAGMVLTGTEIKSLRGQAPNLRDAFVEMRRARGKADAYEAWLLNTHIGPYSHGNIWNHETKRARKLLMHAHQLAQLYTSATQKGLQIIPLRMYFKKGLAKIELGVGKGKKKHDKRNTLKQKDDQRDIDRAMSDQVEGRGKPAAKRSRSKADDYED
jgi:SsrA-binding protein